MKRFLVMALAAAALLTLCACGARSELAPYAGEYTLFAYDIDGYVREAAEMSSVLTLKKNGTGRMTINGDTASITSWEVDGNALALTSGADTLTGTVEDGIIVLDLGEGIWFYAADGADTSGVAVMSREEYFSALADSILGE